MRVNFSRGFPVGKTTLDLGCIQRKPVAKRDRSLRSLADEGQDRVQPGSSLALLCAISDNRASTVSRLSARFVLMMPLGPRLSQPVTNKPTMPTPFARMRPLRFGTTPRSRSKGRPGIGTPLYPMLRNTSPHSRSCVSISRHRALIEGSAFEPVSDQS